MRRLGLIPLVLLAIAGCVDADDDRTPPERPPNFVLVLADDLGFSDLGCYKAWLIKTPRIDAVAGQGLRLTSFYAQPICGPSRAALLTGSHPMRVAERGSEKRIHPMLHPREVTLAEVLKARGYTTACLGKWDLAGHSNTRYAPDLLPQHQGFDVYFGTPSSNDSVEETVLLRGDRLVEKPADQATLTRRYTDEAIRFIEAHRDEPFFVYLPYTMPHAPLAASPEFRGKSRRGLYGDVVAEIDWNFGRLIDVIGALGLAENTYVIFTSDNGPWLIKGAKGGSARPLRAGKLSTWEGGVRVPAIVWGPGRVPAGGTSDQLMTTMDILPTLTALAGAALPKDRVIDGNDVSAVWHDEPGAASPTRTYYYYLWTHLQAVRSEKWKLHVPRPARPPWLGDLVLANHVAPEDYVEILRPLLFDLEADPGERNDVAAQHPEVVERLMRLVEKAREDLGDYDRSGSGQRFFDPRGQARSGVGEQAAGPLQR